MGADQILVTAIYFFISLLGFLFWRSISKHYSGDNFTVKWFWICLLGVLLWAAAQSSVAHHGSLLFFSPPLEFLEHNDWVRWIAFISWLLQGVCIPSKTMRNP